MAYVTKCYKKNKGEIVAKKFNPVKAAKTRKKKISIESLGIYLLEEFGIEIEQPPEIKFKKGTDKWNEKTKEAFQKYATDLEKMVYKEFNRSIKVIYFTELTAKEIKKRKKKMKAAESV